MSFIISTDSAANLPTVLLNKHNIKLIPLSYRMQDKEYFCMDQDSFNGEEFFDKLRDKAEVTTSLINPDSFLDFFKPYLEDGMDVLYVGLSSGVSGTLNSAQLAADELAHIYPDRRVVVVDSLGASLGEGLQVLNAANYRDMGLTIQETAETILSERMNVNQFLIVGDLMHLHRTGRVSGVAAIIGSKLKITPLLHGNFEGKIVAYGKTIGRKRALQTLAELYQKRHDPLKKKLVGISHCGCAADAEFLAEQIRRIDNPDKIITVCFEPVTGSHVGPDTVAVFFMGEER